MRYYKRKVAIPKYETIRNNLIKSSKSNRLDYVLALKQLGKHIEKEQIKLERKQKRLLALSKIYEQLIDEYRDHTIINGKKRNKNN